MSQENKLLSCKKWLCQLRTSKRRSKSRAPICILDALIGYGLKGAPRGELAELIRLANASYKPILAPDAPSGLDTSTGEVDDPCIRAHATLTLALPKTGLYVQARHM